MRFLLVFTGMLLIGPIICAASEMTDKNPPREEVLHFEESVHDFGNVYYKDDVGFTFKFENVSEKEIAIQEISTSCGCTIAREMADNVFHPGEKGEIAVTFSPSLSKRMGESEQDIFLDLSDQTHINLKIRAIVYRLKSGIYFKPELLDFGEFTLGKDAEQKIDFYQVNRRKIEIEKVEIPGSKFSYSEKYIESNPMENLQVSIGVGDGLEVGSFTEDVRFFFKGEPEPASITLTGHFAGDVDVQPKRIFFDMKRGQKRSYQIVLRTANPKGIEITSVYSNLDFVSVSPYSRNLSSEHVLEITIESKIAMDRVSGEISIETSSDYQPKISVPLFGVVKQIPD
jgi:hypothetical protein